MTKRLFSSKEVQQAFLDAIGTDSFRCFKIKMQLFEENGVTSYEPLTRDEVDRAEELYQLYTKRDIPEEDEKEMMATAIQCDPFQSCYYRAALDKYYDPQGEIRRLATVMDIDILSYIEKKLSKIYSDGNIGTLKSTLELKQVILDEQKKYCLENSKALEDVTYRQYFLELSDKAYDMSNEEILAEWQSIQDGNNTFVGEKGSHIDDKSAVLVLSRNFRKHVAAEYHDVIRELGLEDDTSEGDKNYAFYNEGDNYIVFENECLKAIDEDIPRDEDLSQQNYADDTLASGEVMLGYFHYTRSMDLLGSGKSLVITNKRIFTTKEKFTAFAAVSICKPVKKLLLNYLVFQKTDGSGNIELPVNKEIMVASADMINRLITALTGTEYKANSAEVTNSEAMEKAKGAVLNAASSAKKGIGSLMGKFKK
jgi:hypothetical protein